jgi:hypothetical protein
MPLHMLQYAHNWLWVIVVDCNQQEVLQVCGWQLQQGALHKEVTSRTAEEITRNLA